MIGKINTGGGAIKRAFAYVSVSYPLGATCTCTNSDGYSDITPTLRIFYINSLSVPFDCLVRIYNGSTYETSSGKQKKTIRIESEGQCASITLTYRFYLYNRGDQCTDITGGFVGTPPTSYIGGITFNEDNITLSRVDYGVRTIGKIDLSDFERLHYVYTAVDANTSKVGISSTAGFSSSWVVVHNETKSGGYNDYFEIGNQQSELYVKVENHNTKVIIYELWLD